MAPATPEAARREQGSEGYLEGRLPSQLDATAGEPYTESEDYAQL
jgi:hypothetical protein